MEAFEWLLVISIIIMNIAFWSMYWHHKKSVSEMVEYESNVNDYVNLNRKFRLEVYKELERLSVIAEEYENARYYNDCLKNENEKIENNA